MKRNLVKMIKQFIAARAFETLIAWFDSLPPAEHAKHRDAVVPVLDILRIYINPRQGEIEGF